MLIARRALLLPLLSGGPVAVPARARVLPVRVKGFQWSSCSKHRHRLSHLEPRQHPGLCVPCAARSCHTTCEKSKENEFAEKTPMEEFEETSIIERRNEMLTEEGSSGNDAKESSGTRYDGEEWGYKENNSDKEKQALLVEEDNWGTDEVNVGERESFLHNNEEWESEINVGDEREASASGEVDLNEVIPKEREGRGINEQKFGTEEDLQEKCESSLANEEEESFIGIHRTNIDEQEDMQVHLNRRENDSMGEQYEEVKNWNDLPDYVHNEEEEEEEEEDYPALPQYREKDSLPSEPIWLLVRGLPFTARPPAIRAFFDGLRILPHGVHLCRREDGRPKGIALVALENRVEARKALARHGDFMGNRYIEVFPCNSQDKSLIDEERHFATKPPLPTIIDSRLQASRPFAHDSLPSAHDSFSSARVSRSSAVKKSNVVHMRGLPFSSNEEDIAKFFHPLKLVNITIDSRPGEANAHFACHKDAIQAMERQHHYIGFADAVPLC
uniref:RRM domain-containing protein n=1 Tax=Eptatretus burgeri TaxID=7764 RepID=A0A8C4WW06_EPTBU